jgi:hypothetical protein
MNVYIRSRMLETQFVIGKFQALFPDLFVALTFLKEIFADVVGMNFLNNRIHPLFIPTYVKDLYIK